MQTNTAKFTGKPLEVVPDSIDAPSAPRTERSWLRVLAPAFTFMGVMGAFTLLAVPASAELNLSFVGDLFGTLFQALTDIMPDFEGFIDAGFPVLIKVIIYVAIIAIIGLGLYMAKEVIQKVVKMIGF